MFGDRVNVTPVAEAGGRLETEVVEKRDPVVVGDVEEEVNEVGMLLGPPSGRAGKVSKKDLRADVAAKLREQLSSSERTSACDASK